MKYIINFKHLIFCILTFAFVCSFAYADNIEDNALSEYDAITSQDEWYIGRVIAKFTVSGIGVDNINSTEKVLNRYKGRRFTYNLLDNLQNDLFSLGFIESIDPKVDITKEFNLNLILDFTELSKINEIKFLSQDEDATLEIADKELFKCLEFKKGDYVIDNQVRYSVLSIEDYYKSIGRSGTKVEYEISLNDNNTKNIVYKILEAHERKVAKVLFTGNFKTSTRKLTNLLATKTLGSAKNAYFDPDNITKDIENLQSFYNNAGYIDATVVQEKIENINTDKNDTHEKIEITYKITEGEMWKIGKITFFNNTIFTSKELLSKLSLKSNDIYNAKKFENDKETLLNGYYALGYVFARINASIKRSRNNTIDIEYQFIEGLQAYIEKVNFNGLIRTKEFVFRRELAINDGDVFNRDKLQESYQNIYNTGLISQLNYSLERGSDDEHLIMNFDIEEAQNMDLSFGISFGGTEGGFPLSFVASFNNKNFMGEAKTLSLGTNITTDYQSLNFSYGSGWFKDTRWANSFSFSFERSNKDNILQKNPNSEYQIGRNNAYPYGYSSYDEYEAYDESIPETKYLMSYEMYRVALGYNTGYTWIFNKSGRLSISFGLSIGLNHVIYNENEYVPFEYLIYQYNNGWRFSNRASFGIVWDGRDYVQDPTKGYMISQNFVYAGGILQGLSNYIKSSTSLSGYLTIFKLNENDVKPRSLVGSLTTSVSFVLPQFWDAGKNIDGGLKWHDAKLGATRSEMLYIDGMRNARGHNIVYDISFMWDSILELSFPIVKGIVNLELFSSMTAASKNLDNFYNSIIWYGAFGVGAKLKISGFPLGFYFTGDYKIKDGNLSWVSGGLFDYVHPVIAISTSLI